jgi:hypothetical protein
MREDYYEVYRELYDHYRFSGAGLEDFGFLSRWISRAPALTSDGRDLRMIEDAITAAQADLGLLDRLRPDAKLFLLINLHQMVTRPVAMRRTVSGEQPPLDSYVREDVHTILETAKEEAREREVSGHAIVVALSRIWEKLRTNQLDVWG